MLLLPDPTTAYVDLFRKHKSINVNFFIHDPLARERCARDPRNVARKVAEAFNSLFKAELIRHNGPWRSIDDLEIADSST